MNRYYMEQDRIYHSGLWNIYDRTRKNQWGERWCEASYLSERDAQTILAELNSVKQEQK